MARAIGGSGEAGEAGEARLDAEVPAAQRRFDRILAIAMALVFLGIVGAGILSRSPARDVEEGAPASGEAAPAAQPPAQASSQPDFEAIMRHIMSVRSRALAEGRPELVDEIYSPKCSCSEGLKKPILEGVRYIGYDPKVIKVEVRQTMADVVSLHLTAEQPPFTVLDGKGGKFEDPGFVGQKTVFDLTRDDGGRWVVVHRLTIEKGSPPPTGHNA